MLAAAMFRITLTMMSIEGCASPVNALSRRCGSMAMQDSSWQEQDGWRCVCVCVCEVTVTLCNSLQLNRLTTCSKTAFDVFVPFTLNRLMISLFYRSVVKWTFQRES